ncbi:MAG: selenocysteine-specific translation elongation factor [Syntrophomonadaceae bacterium]|jgi:selenocysteine-specific elongation factor|nr:selenocysteine-specific translation elongation factor [Syntrophomonadaceae bacterium]
MKRFIIGTAGHIDHGKTTLVKALTGVDTDRLKEEKQRGISIDLGFAPFKLPGGQKAAIVDVPGHERFIRHMLAGAFGIDMVLLTIAADEGVMPQTREHMDIIELLGVDKGLVVITKKDLVDEEWMLLMEEEISEYLKGTILDGAPLMAVSAVTGEGIPDLLAAIENIAQQVQERSAEGYARLPIDRVFTIAGFGTVVTGTLWSGKINSGDTLELMPGGLQVKVRNLHVHNDKVNTAYAGQRVAVNLQGIELAEVRRGDLLATPGVLAPSYRIDARLRLLKSSKRSLSNWNRIRFHLGTDETMGRVVLLDRDQLNAGEEALVQLVMEKPVVAYQGDRFVIRYYSPVTTIGGGVVIDPRAPKQKRFREDVLEELSKKEEGTLYERILLELENKPEEILTLPDLVKLTGSDASAVSAELKQLQDDGKVEDLKNGDYISQKGLNLIREQIRAWLAKYHQDYPLRAGYSREDLRSRFFPKINARRFNVIVKYLEEQGVLVSVQNNLALPQHQPRPGADEQKMIEQIMMAVEKDRFSPPSLKEIKSALQVEDSIFNELAAYLLESGQLIKISQDMVFSAQAIEAGKQILQEYFNHHKELTLAAARDLFNTSRKYALPLVEYYDRIRFTKRMGDIRVKI